MSRCHAMPNTLDSPGVLISQQDCGPSCWAIDVQNYFDKKYPERSTGSEGWIARPTSHRTSILSAFCDPT